jgi:hypothetical protein
MSITNISTPFASMREQPSHHHSFDEHLSISVCMHKISGQDQDRPKSLISDHPSFSTSFKIDLNQD